MKWICTAQLEDLKLSCHFVRLVCSQPSCSQSLSPPAEALPRWFVVLFGSTVVETSCL